jgi:hypothetical protein
MRDIYGYLSRLGVAVLLCPVAAGAWFLWALAGFSFDGFMAFLGTLSQQYAAMDADGQAVFRFQVYAVWGAMAFGFLLVTFAVNPPDFGYRLRKENGHWRTEVTDPRSGSASSE